MNLGATYILIGCGAAKAEGIGPFPARELYVGPLFRAARGYAEASGQCWAIVSAWHRLVLPDAQLYPYDYRLPRAIPFAHSWELRADLDRLTGGVGHLELHMGADYAAWVADVANTIDGLTYSAPLSGLEIGERLSWYRQRRAA